MSRACVYVHVYVCMCTYVYVCVCACMYVCMHVYVRVHVYIMNIVLCVLAYYRYRIMCTSIFIDIALYVCTYVCMYVCIQHSIDIVLYVLVHYEYRIMCIQHSINIVLHVFSIKQENVEKQDLQGLGYMILCLSLFLTYCTRRILLILLFVRLQA